jgi:hypothetical protein
LLGDGARPRASARRRKRGPRCTSKCSLRTDARRTCEGPEHGVAQVLLEERRPDRPLFRWPGATWTVPLASLA